MKCRALQLNTLSMNCSSLRDWSYPGPPMNVHSIFMKESLCTEKMLLKVYSNGCMHFFVLQSDMETRHFPRFMPT